MHWGDLEVWQRAHAMVLRIYRATAKFPDQEKYRLASQLCRAAISVPSNIVEGHSRRTTREYVQFLCTARGSLEETRYLCLLAKDLGYMTATEFSALEAEGESVSRMLNALLKSLGRKAI